MRHRLPSILIHHKLYFRYHTYFEMQINLNEIRIIIEGSEYDNVTVKPLLITAYKILTFQKLLTVSSQIQ
uniref:Uncharacterized protein n=1 Tax=Trichobilharzia regenti TaxID=157069 RepID=A0AA85IXL0_TRIRE|nr:unnamed protein product [Trichobilharzia regenti]